MNQLMPLQNLLKPKRLSTPLELTDKRLVMLMCSPHMILQRKSLPLNPINLTDDYLCVPFRTPFIFTRKLFPLLKRRTVCVKVM